jgi:hypothetical protein
MANEKAKEELAAIAQAMSAEEVGVSGDGHGEASSEVLADERYKEFRRRELEKNIPGIGSLYQADDEFLGEGTRLNDREVAAYAVGDMQEAMSNLESRTESLWSILKRRSHRYKISLNGDGRQEQILLHRIKNENEIHASMEGANLGGS